MNTTQVYLEYMMPVNLQEHMLRVGALASIILESWKGAVVDSQAIVQACLYHDIAKPIMFDLKKQKQFGMTDEEVHKLDMLQKRLITAYGNNEHQASVKVCESIGCNAKTVNILDNIEWQFIPRLMKEQAVEPLIAIYCDMRISPKGILPLIDRLDDLQARRQGEYFPNDDALKLEAYIIKNSAIDPNTVTDKQINAKFESLRCLEVC